MRLTSFSTILSNVVAYANMHRIYITFKAISGVDVIFYFASNV